MIAKNTKKVSTKTTRKSEHPRQTASGKHDHSSVMPAARRVAGQLKGVEKMIEEGRYCPEILTQIRAVRAALRSLEAKILEDHLKSCVMQCFSSPNEKDKETKIKEVLELFKNS